MQCRKRLRRLLSGAVQNLRAVQADVWLQRYLARQRRAGDAVHRLMWCLLVMACTATVPPSPTKAVRDTATPIYSNAQLDPSRMVGRWVQVADFAPKGARCTPGGVDISPAEAGLKVVYRLCQSGRDIRGAGAMQPAGPGRFVVPNQPGPWQTVGATGVYPEPRRCVAC